MTAETTAANPAAAAKALDAQGADASELSQRPAAADGAGGTAQAAVVKDARPSPRANCRTTQVYLVAVSRMMCYLTRAQLSALLPFLMQELSLTSLDRGYLMSRYASGYLLTQIPGGILADKLGGYVVVAMVIVATAACCVAAPLLASSGSTTFGIPFFVMGLCQGAVLPAGNVMMARWILPSERSWASAITSMGACLGTLVINFLAARIASFCGWRAVFYSTAFGCIAFLAAWLRYAVSSPEHCASLTQEEFTLLQQAGVVVARADDRAKTCDPSGSKDASKKSSSFNPTLLLHTSVWTVILCNFVQNCQQYFAEWLPFFYDTQLAMSPDLASFHLVMIASVEMPARALTKDMPERLLQRGWSLQQCRKIMSLQGFFYHLVLCVILATFLHCDVTWPVAFTLLFTLSKAVQAFHSGGYFANYLDLTRNYAGMLTGVGNTVASCAGVVVPQFIARTLQGDDRNWLPVIAGLVFINMIAIGLIAEGMSTRCLDDALQSPKVEPEDVNRKQASSRQKKSKGWMLYGSGASK
eukprot:gnl/TRDRNA2_/TRDRNA2_90518_c0_seq1.p1 gnl/TRDRNA2_/TRDRNA2_90518_c0~~gnl/TRDRNA2_/TRDRNA2_90518_c0_seq1.p1  ORF type:complete len:529 (-),score=82.98 gnl/TRDRNA2_/TRDRNA2_90518_c0_seq1:61-1647(-)